MNVLYYPAVSGNPYWEMIQQGMQQHHVQTKLWQPWDLRQQKHPVLHLHWIESLGMDRLTRRSLLATRLAFHRLERQIQRIQGQGGKVVWTAHNAAPHEHRDDPHSLLVAEGIARVVQQVDVIISLSQAGVKAIREAQPGAKAPIIVIPHQNYVGHYPEGQGLAYREALGIPAGARVVGMIGLIRPYKEIERGISLFREIKDENAWLLISGNCFDPALSDRLRKLADATPRVVLQIAHLSEQQFADAHAACDLVLVAQRKMLNSGSVISALSLGVPVLSGPTGSLPELQEVAGQEWLQLEEELDASHIAALLHRGRPCGRPDLSPLDLDNVVDQHLHAYGIARQVYGYEDTACVP